MLHQSVKIRLESIRTVFFLDSFQKLIDQMHQEVTAEYVRRLLKGELKLKDKALQLKACEVVTDDAESLTRLFVAMVRRRHQTFQAAAPSSFSRLSDWT